MTAGSVPSPAGPADELANPGRVIGRVEGAEPGPTLIGLGGVHGNEPAGVRALHRLLEDLRRQGGPSRGEFVALTGNITALAQRSRFIDKDLNRQWEDEHLRRLAVDVRGAELSTEDHERLALLREIRATFDRATAATYIVDIHTTSSVSAPFLLFGDTLRNRRFALDFPVPKILGLEEYIDGTLSEYLTERGHVTLVFEAGQHDEEGSIDNAHAAVWIALAAAGLVDGGRHPRVRAATRHLAAQVRGLPSALEVLYRHPVTEGDGFAMRPGFENFARIDKGQVLASDDEGEIRSRWDARLLMPLYQRLGDDGFFVVREFSRFWLAISRALRRLGADRIVHWLPGVSRHPSRPDTRVIDRRIARWRTLQVLHLLGFRRHRQLGEILLVSRRESSKQ